MIKQALAALAASVVLFASVMPALAEGEQRVFDNADILTDREEQLLEESIADFTAEYEADLVILTERDSSVSDPELHAQDYYDEQGFGVGEERSGMILYVNMSTREVVACASGETKYTLSNQRLDYVVDAGFDQLADGNYADSFLAMIDNAASWMPRGEDPNAGNPNHYYTPVYEQREYPVVFLFAGVALGLISGGVMYKTIAKQYAAVSREATYQTQENTHLNLNRDNDVLIDTRMTSRLIQNPSSSSGGSRTRSSGFRTSSSGRSFSSSRHRF